MVRTSDVKRGKRGNVGRRGRYGKPGIVLVALLVMGLLTVLLYFLMQNKSAQAPVEAPEQASELPAQELSVWITDWQWEAGIEDWSALHKGTVDVQLFAAYFDERDELYFTETMSNALPRLHELTGVDADSDAQIGLTLVNDIIHDDGSAVQKDPELLTRLTATNESRARHMESITKIVERYGLDQIEIDYEQIKDQDWPNMIRFYEELALELDEMNVSLRIVLEPKAPIEELKLPEGPEYVMMAYNLYGGHSGPGPKADMAFIEELAARMSHLPGDPVIAFSAGALIGPKAAARSLLRRRQPQICWIYIGSLLNEIRRAAACILITRMRMGHPIRCGTPITRHSKAGWRQQVVREFISMLYGGLVSWEKIPGICCVR